MCHKVSATLYWSRALSIGLLKRMQKLRTKLLSYLGGERVFTANPPNYFLIRRNISGKAPRSKNIAEGSLTLTWLLTAISRTNAVPCVERV